VVEIETSVGLGRWHIDAPERSAGLTVALGHGAGGGVDSADLALLACQLPALGHRVARFEQPWRVAGRRVAGPPSQLDRAWLEALDALPARDHPLVLGGRSAGARVACRTAQRVGAVGVLALAFPLHPPGRPERSRADELPALPMIVIQGGRDPFGTVAELTEVMDSQHHLALEIAGADHSLRVARSGPITQAEADETMVLAVRRWLSERGNESREPAR
jgi:hypothetical protein